MEVKLYREKVLLVRQVRKNEKKSNKISEK